MDSIQVSRCINSGMCNDRVNEQFNGGVVSKFYRFNPKELSANIFDCGICLSSNMVNMKVCNSCFNSLCNECSERVEQQCPFCRNYYSYEVSISIFKGGGGKFIYSITDTTLKSSFSLLIESIEDVGDFINAIEEVEAVCELIDFEFNNQWIMILLRESSLLDKVVSYPLKNRFCLNKYFKLRKKVNEFLKFKL